MVKMGKGSSSASSLPSSVAASCGNCGIAGSSAQRVSRHVSTRLALFAEPAVVVVVVRVLREPEARSWPFG
jgi:hypothetical protein